MKTKYLLIFCLIIIAGFLRFYKLSEFPVQLDHDEISQLYDTESIVKTGRDVYGNFLPLAFPSTGDYKIGHYIYISTIPYLIFGHKEFTIRIASAFFGTFTVLAVFLFTYSFSGEFWIALISGALVAITPSEIFYSRKSFENVIGVSLVFFGLYYLFNSLSENKKNFFSFVGVLFLVMAMYVYTSHTIVVPLLILSFFAVFRKQIGIEKLILPTVFGILLVIPLGLLTLTNPDLRFRAASVFINQDLNLLHKISISSSPIKTSVDYVFLRYLNQFNPSYIFGNGLDFTNQGLLGMGPLLFIEFPLLIIGIIFIIRTKYISRTKKTFLFFLGVLPMIPSALTFEQFSPHRAMLEFTVLSMISGYGLFWVFKSKKWLTYLFLPLIIINFIYFLHMYTVNYPYEKSQQIHFPFKEISIYAWSSYANFDSIIIDPVYGQAAPVYGVATQYYLAYYGNYPPDKFQRDLKIKPDGITFDKFYIRKVDWRKDQNLKKTLIIASPWEIPLDQIDKSKIIKTFSFFDGQIAFYAVALN